MTLDDLLPYILPKAKGCPEITATMNARLAVIELCQKAMIWREYQTAIPTVALQTAYAYTPTANQQVCTLLGVALDGIDVDVVAADIGKAKDIAGCASNYAYGTFSGFELHPAQVEGLSIVTYATVAPSIAAMVLPDAMGQYIEAIAQGALSRIMTHKGRDYFDLAGAGIAKALWDDAIADAKNDALTGFARATVRTSKIWF